jgi:hypothetical protein
MCPSLLVLLALLPTSADAPSGLSDRSAAAALLEMEPQPSKAQPLDRWPNAQDLDRLSSVEGKAKWKVIRVLGHPSAVERRDDGTQVWIYPWCASCRVWIKNGVCTGTFYTSGY